MFQERADKAEAELVKMTSQLDEERNQITSLRGDILSKGIELDSANRENENLRSQAMEAKAEMKKYKEMLVQEQDKLERLKRELERVTQQQR